MHIFACCVTAVGTACLTACSGTSGLEDGEQLYTGMKKTVYKNYESSQHFIDTQAELEAALACPPNGALFGSSYLRTPFPYALWIHNAFAGKKGAVAKWISRTLGKAPVLMSDVNPELRVTVGENVLQNNGYFRGSIDYKIIEGKKGMAKTDTVPRALTGKLSYTVNLGPLYTLDSIEYRGFSDKEMALIRTTPTLLHKNDAFSVSMLDEERTRIYNIFKNSGYYFFEKSHITYMADTIKVPQHVQLQICKVDSLPEDALRQWKVGTITYRIRHQMMEQTTDTIKHKYLNVVYGGKRLALRGRVVLQDLQLRPKKLFSQSDLTESLSRLTTKGIFSSTNISFTKIDDTFNTDSTATDSIGTMNMLVDCVLDKPYDFSLSANYTQKASGRGGPGVGAGFAMRNAFHGGEILSFNLKGNIEYQIGNKVQDRDLNYEMGADISLQMPRLLLPNFMRKHKHWYIPPSTIFTLAYNRINRSGYYRRNVFTSEFSYIFKPSQSITHTFTPLSIAHNRLAYSSDEYVQKMSSTGYGLASLDSYLTPKMRYTFNYTTKAFQNNPIALSVTLTESGLITSGILNTLGQKKHVSQSLDTLDIGINEISYDTYQLFKTPVVRYGKVEMDFVKTWRTNTYSRFVAHFFAGYLHSFSHDSELPFSELYYTGGANDLRGFATRSVGPGCFHIDDSRSLYLFSNGKLKLTCNLEYRPRIFGSLYGALFVDMGNVWEAFWNFFSEESKQATSFKLNNLHKDLAVDAGVGIRYDLDFFVIRLDWGFIVHAPYDTGRSGYFNFPSFQKGQCLNFAIGYPF